MAGCAVYLLVGLMLLLWTDNMFQRVLNYRQKHKDAPLPVPLTFGESLGTLLLWPVIYGLVFWTIARKKRND
jgi:hypothetical protein